MTRTMLIAAAALILPATSALAQSAVPAGPGALSGRSPHHAYRTDALVNRQCGKTMHSLPAGKLPTYGWQSPSAARCDNEQIAIADDRSHTARD